MDDLRNQARELAARALVATRTGPTLSGGYRLDRSYRFGGPDGVTIEVTVMREPTMGASQASATLSGWDHAGQPLPVLADLSPERWYVDTPARTPNVAAALGPVGESLLRRACLQLRIVQ